MTPIALPADGDFTAISRALSAQLDLRIGVRLTQEQLRDPVTVRDAIESAKDELRRRAADATKTLDEGSFALFQEPGLGPDFVALLLTASFS